MSLDQLGPRAREQQEAFARAEALRAAKEAVVKAAIEYSQHFTAPAALTAAVAALLALQGGRG